MRADQKVWTGDVAGEQDQLDHIEAMLEKLLALVERYEPLLGHPGALAWAGSRKAKRRTTNGPISTDAAPAPGGPAH